MDPAQENVLRRDALRLALLRELYDLSDGSERPMIPLDTAGDALGLDRIEAWQICEYLRGEMLLEVVASGPMVSLTHAGVVEVEATIRHPDSGTDHFSPRVINQTIIIANEIANTTIAVDAGSVQQTVGALDRGELEALLQELRDMIGALDLGPEEEAAVAANLGSVDAQLQAPRPGGRIIRAALSSSQHVLEGASGTAAAPALTMLLERLAHAITQLPI